MSERVLFSREAEQAILGGIMYRNDAFDRVADKLTAGDLYGAAHRVIYAAIAKLLGDGKSADAVSVAEHLQLHGQLDEAGGLPCLGKMVQEVATTANIEHYALTVRNFSLERKLAAAAVELAELARGLGPVQERMDQAQAMIFAITEEVVSNDPKPIKTHVHEFLEVLELRHNSDSPLIGLTTSLKDLDELLTGLHGGQLIVLGGRPAMGKTSLAMQMGYRNALAGKSVGVFSMEMQGRELAEKAISNIGRIPLDQLRDARQLDWDRISSAVGRLADAKLIVDQTPALSVQQIRARARSIKRKHGLDLVIVDYLQLMHGIGENRTQAIGEISHGLKAIAKELDIPVIALSQLSRKCEEQKRKPIMSDLREGGDIEQDADVVILMYREEVYNENTEFKGICELIVAKQRMGAIKTVNCTFMGEYGAFGDTDWSRKAMEEKKPAPAKEVQDVF